MPTLLRFAFLACCINLAAFTDPPCTIELECEECVPDNMPLVTSHRAANGSVLVAPGDEVSLSCAGGKFVAYPLLSGVQAVCEAGRYRVRRDGQLRHLLELGCQENVFEDVLHQVEHCPAPLQGRTYLVRAGDARHVAAVCYDADRALAVWARAAPAGRLALSAHAERAAPLSLLGNFNHMFDASTRAAAERLYSDDARMTRRLRELLRHDAATLADHTLTSATLLSGRYFGGQDARAAAFVSNRVPVWRDVAAGNLRHAQRDVARLAARARAAGATLHVVAGTRGAGSVRAGGARRALHLRAGRFPVPRYIWTVVVWAGAPARALALVVLNDPLVAVSEIRELVFCESACGRAAWLRALRTNRNYETPALGLTFCCAVHNFTAVATEMPAELLRDVPPGDQGMLLDYLT